ncbi:hypothetical protein ABT282_08755 [Streptomyces sp. NPDC000927]|uniref:hypothetical protein n=1 Tax=Streptomyces sp. NPDC000927 TaxID=3154371 RepID=UPI00332744E4
MSSLTGVEVLGDFDFQEWRRGASVLIDEWLSEDFTWGDSSLGSYIRSIDVDVAGMGHNNVWKSNTPPIALPTGKLFDGNLEDADFNMWHPVWFELVNLWALKGRWLHPETSFMTQDQMRLAESSAGLYIGTRDRDNPDLPRRYDAEKNPMSHDIGVIYFPLRSRRILRYIESGAPLEQAFLQCVGTAIAESAVHEALEMHQKEAGVPVLDPHTKGLKVNIRVFWTGCSRPTEGFSHAN